MTSTSRLPKLASFGLAWGFLPIFLLGGRANAHPAPSPFSELAGDSSQSDLDEELRELLQEERAEADRLRRRGDSREAQKLVDEHLADDPTDAESRVLRARMHLDRARYDKARADAGRALRDAMMKDGSGDIRAAAARTLGRVLLEVGEAEAALGALQEIGEDLKPEERARDAWLLGRALLDTGKREEAFDLWRSALRTSSKAESAKEKNAWRELLARAEIQRALGDLRAASKTLVAADALAARGDGPEPDILKLLGDVYFEADREVEAAAARSPFALYEEALKLSQHNHVGTLLSMFELHRYNWRRRRRSAPEFLEDALLVAPGCIPVLVAGASADLADGKLPKVRERLAQLKSDAPKLRSVRTIEAALAWVEHRRDDARAILATLAKEDPADSVAPREVGRHLLELYRFKEAVEFLEDAVERDESDHLAWTQLARALANTGREDEARVALAKAVEEAGGRQDAWRDNMAQVLRKMDDTLTDEKSDDLAFRWQPAAAGVLRTYLFPFYTEAREEFAVRYGYTAPPTLIEVFDDHSDFSVRSTGFTGFPALGVCFGPVVTAVSPLSEMRGTFSWARTAFHEFSHVVHLGISHNRCPRWITEGLATWEETNRNPTWTRNMRRDLIDSRAAGTIIPVRDLNRAFRGPRILFGYYQGGLLCEMLIEDFGFPPMIRLLEAFDRGLDLDQAFQEVYKMSPEEVDERFAAWIDVHYGNLAVEPRWPKSETTRLRYSLGTSPPSDPDELKEWTNGWATVAWGAWQRGNKVDAQEALRTAARGEAPSARIHFLRGEIALGNDRKQEGKEHLERGLALGGDEFRARMYLGSLALMAEDPDTAEEHYLAAEGLFPGYGDQGLSAELRLAELYESLEREDDEMMARSRWFAWNAGEVPMRRKVAAWHMENERPLEAAKLYREVNEVDPFLREVHVLWSRALQASGDYETALREAEVALAVPFLMDGDEPGQLDPEQRAELLGLQAELLLELDRVEEAEDRARAALELDDDLESAARVLEELR